MQLGAEEPPGRALRASHPNQGPVEFPPWHPGVSLRDTIQDNFSVPRAWSQSPPERERWHNPRQVSFSPVSKFPGIGTLPSEHLVPTSPPHNGNQKLD